MKTAKMNNRRTRRSATRTKSERRRDREAKRIAEELNRAIVKGKKEIWQGKGKDGRKAEAMEKKIVDAKVKLAMERNHIRGRENALLKAHGFLCGVEICRENLQDGGLPGLTEKGKKAMKKLVEYAHRQCEDEMERE